MSNVLKFPKKFRSPRRVAPFSPAMHAAKPASRPAVKAGLAFVWACVRLPLFLVLYWLRLPVMLLCNFVSIPALAAFLFSWYAFPEKTHMVAAFAVVSFAAFVVLWCYDFVLMTLSPQDLVKSL